ncbi:MAG: 2Fe-2S iron-sulfur cluster binding domain-containing protein [Gammaproteobacteria bacterium]|nr:2Fe-2S iron-sulfur cluster binding domain-containing protein [Gammaproteobacteria bacterium]
MPQFLNLSRAARLAGVTRGELQKKIRKGELKTFEGEVAVNDLLRVYPKAELEQNEMLDRVAMIKQRAMPKTRYGDGAQPVPKIIATRLDNLNTTLAQTKGALNAVEALIEGAVAKLKNLAAQGTPIATETILEIADWLEASSQERDSDPDRRARLFAKDAFLRIIAASVKVIPSGHEYFVEGTESILEASLRAGLSMDYGCTNGNCGSCKVRVLSGEVWKLRDHDYLLGPTERDMGYILTCCNTAVTDVVLEASEAFSPSDLPAQSIRAGIRKIQNLDDNLLLLRVQTPRAQTLRFFAGQKIKLTLEEGGSSELHLAGCPCDGRNLEFLVRRQQGNLFSETVFNHTGTSPIVLLEGPSGAFVLNDNSASPLLLIAFGDAFAPVKSIVEHAISIDLAESFHLYWFNDLAKGNYLDRLCRSWNDALDNFHYHSIRTAVDPEQLIGCIAAEGVVLGRCNCYVAGEKGAVEGMIAALTGAGLPEDQLSFESIG